MISVKEWERTQAGSLINNNINQYDTLRKRRESAMAQRSEVESLKTEVDQMKDKLENIESTLSTLVSLLQSK